MSFIDGLTPKDTEEIKPELFIQKKGDKYRQVYPLAWNGKLRWKEQLKTIISVRTIFTLAIILFLVYAYTNDVQEYKTFYENIMSNPIDFCTELDNLMTGNPCTPEYEKFGLCLNANTSLLINGVIN